MSLDVLDCFAGIGGFSVAAHELGWNTLAFVEKDAFCQNALRKNFPGVPIYDDITTFREPRYRGKVDILTAGFPCQPFSVAGRRTGTDDDRFLWPQTDQTIDYYRPRIVVLENVAGLLSMVESDCLSEMESTALRLFPTTDDIEIHTIVDRIERRIIGRIIQDLTEIGYDVPRYSDGRAIILCLPACAVGAWHRRDRIWIVAYDRGAFADAGGFRFGDFDGSDQDPAATAKSKGKGHKRKRLRPESGGVDPADADAEMLLGPTVKRRKSKRDNVADSREPDTDAKALESGAGLCEVPAIDNRAEFADDARIDKESGRVGNRGRRDGDPRRRGRKIQTQGSGGKPEQTDTDERNSRLQGQELGKASLEETGPSRSITELPGDQLWQFPWFVVAAELCVSDDGLSRELSRQRASWRVQALKAIGNSVSPPLVKRIFQAIEIGFFGGKNDG